MRNFIINPILDNTCHLHHNVNISTTHRTINKLLPIDEWCRPVFYFVSTSRNQIRFFVYLFLNLKSTQETSLILCCKRNDTDPRRSSSPTIVNDSISVNT